MTRAEFAELVRVLSAEGFDLGVVVVVALLGEQMLGVRPGAVPERMGVAEVVDALLVAAGVDPVGASVADVVAACRRLEL
ncbi:MAG: hypothetical protein KGQ66_13130 [Acidobacteriota bacterium]|nr:hypothetical protein [Acidobacteriota bacterium]